MVDPARVLSESSLTDLHCRRPDLIVTVLTSMRTCRYCGRENADQALHCLGCGTKLAFAPVNQKAQKSRDWTGSKSLFDGWGPESS